jgi:hypothetical protein
MAEGYRSAAICRRGHVLSTNLEHRQERTGDADVPAFCQKCGAAIMTQCEKCGSVIPGQLIGITKARWSPPAFCLACSAPYPWLDRQGRMYLLENMLENERLDPADALAAREQLAVLSQPDLEPAEAERRWRRLKELAPQLWDKTGARDIMTSVMSAALRSALGL